MKDVKLVRITTVPISLNILLRGQLKYMREAGLTVYTVSADGPEIDEFTAREGVPHKIVEMSRKITPVADARAVYALYRWLMKVQPDIVHSHTPKAGIIGMVAAKMAKVPHRLHTVAGMPLMETSGVKRKVLETVEEITYRCATRVYPNSLNLQQFILGHLSVSRDKLQVLGRGSSNGVDTSFFSSTPEIKESARKIRAELGIAPADVVFTFVGRMVSDKGINELVKAFSEIAHVESNVHLVLVGPFEPDLDPVLPETLQAITTHARIHAVGFQADIRPYLALTDIFTFPSYREGFPNVVLQAASFELPLIVTDINGCNEIVSDEVNGRLIPAKDAGALKTAMTTFLSDPQGRVALGKKARQHIMENYEQARIWELILNEYDQLMHDVS